MDNEDELLSRISQNKSIERIVTATSILLKYKSTSSLIDSISSPSSLLSALDQSGVEGVRVRDVERCYEGVGEDVKKLVRRGFLMNVEGVLFPRRDAFLTPLSGVTK